MMEKIEKIISLLEKEILTKEEEQYLVSIKDTDDDAKRLIKVFNSLKAELQNFVHIEEELLYSYLLLKNGNEPEDKLVYALQSKIEDHLINCSICNDKYGFLETIYSETADHLANTINDNKTVGHSSDEIYPSTFLQKFSTYKYAFVSIASVLILYIGLNIVSSISTPDFKKDLFTEQDNEFYKTRGRTSLLFQKALDAIENSNYSDAVNYLNEDISEHDKESSIFYSHYILGLTYLKSSESNFLGMFNNFDVKKVELAIESFNSSIKKNISGNYDNLNLDAHYYLGRSYLLLAAPGSAKEHLNIVINQKGKFYNEATTALTNINN
jgi:hypothetical protein